MIENDYTESDYYVSFDAVFRAIDEYDDYVIDDETGEWYIPISKALSLIENIPPADMQPVVRATWENEMRFKNEDGSLEWHGLCSHCLMTFSTSDVYAERMNFCPNCGADMREVDNDKR